MTTGVGQNSLGARVIIVGAGLMGTHHAAAAHYAGSTVVGIVDRNPDLARSVARRYRNAIADSDLEALLELTKPTIAHICTPPDARYPLVERLAAAKVHALVEKPMASNLAETKSIFDVFDRAGVIVCPVHQYAFQRSVEEAITVLPLIGAVRRITFDIRSAGGGDVVHSYDRIAAEIIPHPLSIIQRLLPGTDVGALGWALQRSNPGEWLASATSDGVMLSIAISMSGRPTRFSTLISGTMGTVELDNFHDYLVAFPGGVSKIAKITQPFIHGGSLLSSAAGNLVQRALRRESAYPGLRTLTRLFHRSAQSSGRISAPISAAEAMAVSIARDVLLAQCPASPGE